MNGFRNTKISCAFLVHFFYFEEKVQSSEIVSDSMHNALNTTDSRKVVLYNWGKVYMTLSKVIMGNGGFYSCLSEPQGVSACRKETQQTLVLMLPPSLLLNHLNFNQAKPNAYYP